MFSSHDQPVQSHHIRPASLEVSSTPRIRNLSLINAKGSDLNLRSKPRAVLCSKTNEALPARLSLQMIARHIYFLDKSLDSFAGYFGTPLCQHGKGDQFCGVIGVDRRSTKRATGSQVAFHSMSPILLIQLKDINIWWDSGRRINCKQHAQGKRIFADLSQGQSPSYRFKYGCHLFGVGCVPCFQVESIDMLCYCFFQFNAFTRLALAGYEALTIMSLMGHKDLKTTMRYIRAVQLQKNVRSQNFVHKLATQAERPPKLAAVSC